MSANLRPEVCRCQPAVEKRSKLAKNAGPDPFSGVAHHLQSGFVSGWDCFFPTSRALPLAAPKDHSRPTAPALHKDANRPFFPQSDRGRKC